MSEFDTINLRNDSDFKTTIFPSIKWVPVSVLGKTKYTNEDMTKIIESNLCKQFKATISNPYELIQYIQNSNFTENLHDHNYRFVNGVKWEIHKSGFEALTFNQGSCASMAGMFYYMLHDKFEDVGTLCIMSNSGNGHAVSYINIEGKYYFIDLYVQMNKYSCNIPIETGKKQDFVRTKYITGGCLKTDSIQNFITFFHKYNIMKKKEFLYFVYKSDVCPPVSMQIEGDKLLLLLPNNNGIEVLNENLLKKITYKFVDYL